jgi:hypothetical protein
MFRNLLFLGLLCCLVGLSPSYTFGQSGRRWNCNCYAMAANQPQCGRAYMNRPADTFVVYFDAGHDGAWGVDRVVGSEDAALRRLVFFADRNVQAYFQAFSRGQSTFIARVYRASCQR